MRYAAHPLLPSLLLLLAGCGIEPSSAVGEATAVRGRLPVLAGAPCTVDFEPATKPGLNCRVNVVCAGVSLYGAKRLGGYAVCEVDDEGHTLLAHETATSTGDGDPAIRIDVTGGEGTVWDDGWEVTLRLGR